MKLFYTSCVAHLADRLPIAKGAFSVRRFSDGELNIKIDEQVSYQPVLVLAATPSPAENSLELLLLLDALSHCNARIYLMLTYFGYARQDQPATGESHAAQLMAQLITRVTLEQAWIVHAHSDIIHQFMPFIDIIPYQFFNSMAQEADIVVAPDQGARAVVSAVAKRAGLPMIVIKKQRMAKEMVAIDDIEAEVEGKKILIIDDIIATGNTLIQAAQALKSKGAKQINAAVTHGIFSDSALALLQESPITTLYVTNSLAPTIVAHKIVYVDIINELESVIRNII